MKISSFAKENNVTTKLLRYYDEIGLLKPDAIDAQTGYRLYSDSQAKRLNWILILKDVGFDLATIKLFLESHMPQESLISALRQCRIKISSGMNESIQKKILIDKLILFIEKEGFMMDKTISMMDYDASSVNELKKNIANIEVFLENVQRIVKICDKDQQLGFLRLDIAQFKQVNDQYGYDVGDLVIWAIYCAIEKQLEALQEKAVCGRAHGDEFIICTIGDEAQMARLSEQIIQSVLAIDYVSLGCHDTKGCYIGGIITKNKVLNDIRKDLDLTFETLLEARKKGKNQYCIK